MTDSQSENINGFVELYCDLTFAEIINKFLPWENKLNIINAVKLVNVNKENENSVFIPVASSLKSNTGNCFSATFKVPNTVPTFVESWQIHISISRGKTDSYKSSIYITNIEMIY